ncbi:MAG: sigma-70 family RNA polymerase sigma factor [Minicystis sp.]
MQEGNVGLLRAVARFDPSHGVRLASYAQYWIRAEIREYVARHYRIVRLGSSKNERRALRLFRKTREQRPEVLAEMSGLSTERVTALMPLLVQGDARLVPSDDGTDPLERLADGVLSAEDELRAAEERERLHDAITKAVSVLSDREQDIVRRRLLSEVPATLEQLSVTWGVSRERVRQIRGARQDPDARPARPGRRRARLRRRRLTSRASSPRFPRNPRLDFEEACCIAQEGRPDPLRRAPARWRMDRLRMRRRGGCSEALGARCSTCVLHHARTEPEEVSWLPFVPRSTPSSRRPFSSWPRSCPPRSRRT